jgi:hypothetical protein
MAWFAYRELRRAPIPPRIIGGVAAMIGIALAINLVSLGYFFAFTSPEHYRVKAWQELVADGDLRVQVAKAGDLVGVGSVVEVSGKILAAVREVAAEVLERHKGFGIPIFDNLKARVVGAMKSRPASPEAGAPSAEEAARLKKEAEALGLGPMQARLYRSDHTLDRARKVREDWMLRLKVSETVLGGVLGFVGLIVLGKMADRAAK